MASEPFGKRAYCLKYRFCKITLFCEEHGFSALLFLRNVLLFVFQGELPFDFAKLGKSEEGRPKRG